MQCRKKSTANPHPRCPSDIDFIKPIYYSNYSPPLWRGYQLVMYASNFWMKIMKGNSKHFKYVLQPFSSAYAQWLHWYTGIRVVAPCYVQVQGGWEIFERHALHFTPLNPCTSPFVFSCKLMIICDLLVNFRSHISFGFRFPFRYLHYVNRQFSDLTPCSFKCLEYLCAVIGFVIFFRLD